MIGNPVLTPTPNLVTNTGWPVVTLGEALVTVTDRNKIKKLKEVVINDTGASLFGLDWDLAFDTFFPPGTWIRSLSKQIWVENSEKQNLDIER